ncbi:hypothetical protein DKX38_011520 [Salix brachista]|uniref:Uncharacterized protein n=1 Tax=Salix brachista TaxID=2182728 RepID=A0A5N5LYX2_9ROSI|nr:hypothetical protein DKX38_011520 [Salix brachista]
MQLEKGRSEASTWICAETELRLIYFGVWDNFGQIIGLKKIDLLQKKIGFVGFLERGMRREDAREEAFGRDSSFWSIAEKMLAFGRDSW